jgi:hypothetical protein
MKYLLLPFLLLAHLVLTAQPTPPDFLHNDDLRLWLRNNWYNGYFSDLGYSGARMQMYGYVDAYNGEIECVYSGFTQPSGFVTFPDPINAEHIIPQSFFGSASPMRSDIFNLRPTHGSVNSARSNYPYGEVEDNSANWYGVNASGDYVSTSTIPANNEVYSEGFNNEFEPREEYKGDIARQVFYFYTMYPTQAGPITDVCDPNELYQWHLNDPVSAEEIERNNRIEVAQGNRNPFVDVEGLVYEAWFWTEVPGCTDPEADNYNAQANTDDGSCTYTTSVEGCTYAEALNYNPLATIDDASCVFTQYISGCTYSDALNYNPQANLDDQSCEFPTAEPLCLGDLNEDTLINVADFLILLGLFDTPCE